MLKNKTCQSITASDTKHAMYRLQYYFLASWIKIRLKVIDRFFSTKTRSIRCAYSRFRIEQVQQQQRVTPKYQLVWYVINFEHTPLLQQHSREGMMRVVARGGTSESEGPPRRSSDLLHCRRRPHHLVFPGVARTPSTHCRDIQFFFYIYRTRWNTHQQSWCRKRICFI